MDRKRQATRTASEGVCYRSWASDEVRGAAQRADGVRIKIDAEDAAIQRGTRQRRLGDVAFGSW